eukprot:1805799-Rhodomonas_salina.1
MLKEWREVWKADKSGHSAEKMEELNIILEAHKAAILCLIWFTAAAIGLWRGGNFLSVASALIGMAFSQGASFYNSTSWAMYGFSSIYFPMIAGFLFGITAFDVTYYREQLDTCQEFAKKWAFELEPADDYDYWNYYVDYGVVDPGTPVPPETKEDWQDEYEYQALAVNRKAVASLFILLAFVFTIIFIFVKGRSTEKFEKWVTALKRTRNVDGSSFHLKRIPEGQQLSSTTHKLLFLLLAVALVLNIWGSIMLYEDITMTGGVVTWGIRNMEADRHTGALSEFCYLVLGLSVDVMPIALETVKEEDFGGETQNVYSLGAVAWAAFVCGLITWVVFWRNDVTQAAAQAKQDKGGEDPESNTRELARRASAVFLQQTPAGQPTPAGQSVTREIAFIQQPPGPAPTGQPMTSEVGGALPAVPGKQSTPARENASTGPRNPAPQVPKPFPAFPQPQQMFSSLPSYGFQYPGAPATMGQPPFFNQM